MSSSSVSSQSDSSQSVAILEEIKALRAKVAHCHEEADRAYALIDHLKKKRNRLPDVHE